MNTIFIARRELLNIMKSSGNREIDEQFNFLREEVKKRTKCGEEYVKLLNKKLSYFKSEYKSRWIKALRMEERFLKNNAEWLDTSISFQTIVEIETPEKKRGRPKIPFECSSERTKRLKTKELRDSIPVNILNYATQMGLRATGQAQASKVLHEITSTSPKRASKYRKAYAKSQSIAKQVMSGEDALAVLVDAKLSRHQYNIIRMSAPEKFPSYKIIQVAKKDCYPKREYVNITSTCAEVTLQALLDHTVERLILTIEPVIESLKDEELEKLCLFSKWGFDGSSGHSSYKQAFHGLEASDSAVFITCIVPLRLICGEKILWQNPRPASTRYCRPLKIEFVKESTDVSILEKNQMDEQIRNLQESSMLIEEKYLHVNHNLIFAMVDGKVCNALTGTTSTQKCYICGATSKHFNRIDEMIERKIKTENLEFGLSVLHGWIRMFECLLHVAYKLPLKKWQARGNDKKIVLDNKARIQKEFRERCGLIVDKPKPGFGNTNDGNTARRFFRNPELSAEITKIDIELIKKMHIIMIVVSSGHEINVVKFREFAQNTARYFVKLYPWFNMPPTLHKYFIHGPEMISSALLPIGQLTEEAQEARNKDFKKYREHYSRKCSREKTNEDIFNSFLVSSDPVITNKRKLQKKKLQQLPKEAVELLKTQTDQHFSHNNNDDEDGDYSDDDYEESLHSDDDGDEIY